MTGRSARIAAAVIAAAGVAVALVVASGGGRPAARRIDWNAVSHLQHGPAPWSSGSRYLPQRLGASGLQALTMEGAALHIHQHLDVYVDGRRVPVPALVGIDPATGFLTQIHTHDASGIVHVESGARSTFTLGQFFCEWGVELTAHCLGPYHGAVSWWVNGARMHGDPSRLVLAQHQEIVLAVGGAPDRVPAAYPFPAGL